MELNLGSTSRIKVVFDGKEEFVRKPKTQELIDMESKSQLAKEKGLSIVETMIEFLIQLGLTREFIMNLDVDALEALVDGLMPAKKK